MCIIKTIAKLLSERKLHLNGFSGNLGQTQIISYSKSVYLHNVFTDNNLI
jgi:hypothetical protein